MNNKTKKIVVAAMFACLICVATMVVKIPSPLKGYINLGDCMVLVSGWLLSPFYSFFAAGIGSALADFFSGYVTYVPATFFIKGIMGIAAHFLYYNILKSVKNLIKLLISGLIAEIIMVLGYYIYEGFLYGFGVSLVNIIPNVIQGIVCLLIAIIAIKFIKKNKVM